LAARWHPWSPPGSADRSRARRQQRIDLSLRGIVFSAAGTAGKRCTTLRRLIVHRSIHDELVERIRRAYFTLPISDPLVEGTLLGPLVDGGAFERMQKALAAAANDGGALVAGGERALADEAPEAFYARPAIVAMPGQTDIVRTETFAPILDAMAYDEFDEVLARRG
jgi:aldehyde dehydrogenase (NAD+)